MTGSGRARPARARWPAATLLAMFPIMTLVSPACGARDGSANPTTPAPPSISPVASTTPLRPVARFAGYSDPQYSRGTSWLCAPAGGSSDACTIANQDTTVVHADGRTQLKASDAPPDAPFDCFYVYPALAPPSGGGAGMTRDTTGEEALVFHQAARLRELCRVYAPLYDQAPVGDQAMAHLDVRAAFRHYMGRWNSGRRMVLIGQSSGAEHLAKLLQEEFDADPELRSLLISAFLIGARVDTAAGSRTGGTFQTIPTCAAPTDTGCVVAWSTTSAATARDVAARWGEAAPGRSRVCVNPASPAGGPGLLTPIVPAEDQDLTTTDVATPFIELPDLLRAECVTTGQVTTLVVRPAGDSGADVRNAAALLTNAPGTGLHHIEAALTLGSVMDLVAGQAGSAPPRPSGR
jgi:hypothetical protein